MADRACGILLKHALLPFARAHPQLGCLPGQFMFTGGSHAACAELAERLKAAPSGAYFSQIDVKRFYEHVSIDYLGWCTGLSQQLIRGFLSTGDIVARGNTTRPKVPPLFVSPLVMRLPTAGPSGPGGDLYRPDRCIAPGSALSPIVGEMVMGNVHRAACPRLDGVLFLASHSDNVGVLAVNEAAALAVLVALRDVFQGHPAGPFPIGKSSMRPVTQGFTFLGYHWTKSDSGVFANLRQATFERWYADHSFRIMSAYETDFPAEFSRLRGSIYDFAASFPLWRGRPQWIEKHERELFGHLTASCAERGIDPYSAVSDRDWRHIRSAIERRDTPPSPYRWTAPPAQDRPRNTLPLRRQDRAPGGDLSSGG